MTLPGNPPAVPDGTRPARVVRVDRSAYDVLSEDGTTRLPALPACAVTVGDWLAVTDDGGWALLPRTSLLVRGASSGASRTQPLAANVAVVIDTPGLRGVALAGSEEGLALAFSDVEELAAACRFADCAHVGEPGCAVQASIDAGDLSAARMESWRKLQRELSFQARRSDARLRAEERAKWKAITRSNRARPARL